ncbi:MAG: septum formation family protein [Ramlibacter sp.]|nr:septum formation family protein [Cryobacterium sp.]
MAVARLRFGARLGTRLVLPAAVIATLAGCSMVVDMLPKAPITDEPATVSPLAATTPVTGLLAGDCLTDAADRDLVDDAGAAAASVVPCAETHDFEVFDRFPIPVDAFPGDVEATAAAESGCASRFEGFAGTGYQDSALDFAYYTPTEQSWAEPGGRNVTCLIYDPAGPGTGSLAGAKR